MMKIVFLVLLVFVETLRFSLANAVDNQDHETRPRKKRHSLGQRPSSSLANNPIMLNSASASLRRVKADNNKAEDNFFWDRILTDVQGSMIDIIPAQTEPPPQATPSPAPTIMIMPMVTIEAAPSSPAPTVGSTVTPFFSFPTPIPAIVIEAPPHAPPTTASAPATPLPPILTSSGKPTSSGYANDEIIGNPELGDCYTVKRIHSSSVSGGDIIDWFNVTLSYIYSHGPQVQISFNTTTTSSDTFLDNNEQQCTITVDAYPGVECPCIIDESSSSRLIVMEDGCSTQFPSFFASGTQAVVADFYSGGASPGPATEIYEQQFYQLGCRFKECCTEPTVAPSSDPPTTPACYH